MNPLRSALRAVGSFLLGTGRDVGRYISLAPPYLSHLLYLISPIFRDLSEHAYGGNAAVFACIRVLTAAIPEPPLKGYIRKEDGEPDPNNKLPYTHPLAQLIRRPNQFMVEFQMWEMATMHLAIVGISHWYKERDRLGRVIGLWPMRPDRVGPVYANAKTDDNPVLLGWSYLVPGTMHYLGIPKEDMLTFVTPDPIGLSGGIVEGRGPLQALAAEISADNAATQFVNALVQNYAQPGIILSVKGAVMSEDDMKLIKAGFMRDFGGMNRGQPAVVDNETVITQTGFSLQQLEFQGLRRISESRAAAVFGVPAIMVGLLVGLESGIRATLGEMREYFTETTCASYWRRYADQFTEGVAREFGEDIVCRFDLSKVRALNTQTLATADRMERAFLRGAAMRAEYRETLGLPANEEDWVYLIPPHVTVTDESGVIQGAIGDAQSALEASAEQRETEVDEDLNPEYGRSYQFKTLQEGQDALGGVFSDLMKHLYGDEFEPDPNQKRKKRYRDSKAFSRLSGL